MGEGGGANTLPRAETGSTFWTGVGLLDSMTTLPSGIYYARNTHAIVHVWKSKTCTNGCGYQFNTFCKRNSTNYCKHQVFNRNRWTMHGGRVGTGSRGPCPPNVIGGGGAEYHPPPQFRGPRPTRLSMKMCCACCLKVLYLVEKSITLITSCNGYWPSFWLIQFLAPICPPPLAPTT